MMPRGWNIANRWPADYSLMDWTVIGALIVVAGFIACCVFLGGQK